MRAVIEELNKGDIPATLEFPGVVYVQLSPELTLVGGNSNPTFDIDVCDGGPELHCVRTVQTPLLADSEDVQAIAVQMQLVVQQEKDHLWKLHKHELGI